MKIYFKTLVLIISFFFGYICIGWSNELQKVIETFENDNSIVSLKKLRSLGEDGDARAQYFLGFIHYIGKGVPQDYKTAIKWYTLSAKQGNNLAQYNLGIMYSFGLGVVPDYKIALKWYTLSAENGNVLAQYNLGRLYYLGNGVKEDLVHAYMWINLSSLSGFKMAIELKLLITEFMSSYQIDAAEKLTRIRKKKKYKGC